MAESRSVATPLPPSDFEHEGHTLQYKFNVERLSGLASIESALTQPELVKNIINDQKAALNNRNKILKIADRHGWDTVQEYMDHPLVDDNEDAVKLLGHQGSYVGRRKS